MKMASAPPNGVELRADALDERDELIGVAGGEGLEVEVHAVGAPVTDGDRDVLGESRSGGAAAQERLLLR